MAREWGYTAKENPVKGVRKNKEKPRDFYADDTIWAAVYSQACDELMDAMDINYLTGQRPADVLKMMLTDIKDGALEVKQNKTKKKLRIMLEQNGVRSQLGRVIDRIRARDRKVASLFLIATRSGVALNKWTLRTRFDDAREAAIKVATEAGQLELAKSIIQGYTKRLSRYRCDNCGFKARQFYWRCPACGGWETYPPRRSEEFDQTL
jgi:lipopolysaccharide biosynthesis regulator YciM